jgi:hypothetical protein
MQSAGLKRKGRSTETHHEAPYPLVSTVTSIVCLASHGRWCLEDTLEFASTHSLVQKGFPLISGTNCNLSPDSSFVVLVGATPRREVCRLFRGILSFQHRWQVAQLGKVCDEQCRASRKCGHPPDRPMRRCLRPTSIMLPVSACIPSSLVGSLLGRRSSCWIEITCHAKIPCISMLNLSRDGKRQAGGATPPPAGRGGKEIERGFPEASVHNCRHGFDRLAGINRMYLGPLKVRYTRSTLVR